MPLTVAIVGCGSIARRHITGYQLVEDAEFVAMCDLDEAKAAAFAGEFGGRAYTDVVTMLETEAPDIVDVCTREMHRDVPVIQCVERGFTTLAEKPLFAANGQYDVRPSDVEVGRRMIEAAQIGGAELFMAFNYRYGHKERATILVGVCRDAQGDDRGRRTRRAAVRSRVDAPRLLVSRDRPAPVVLR